MEQISSIGKYSDSNYTNTGSRYSTSVGSDVRQQPVDNPADNSATMTYEELLLQGEPASGADPLKEMIDKVLTAASLPKNSKNMIIASELLANNMSVDKQNIQKIISQSYLNRDISISTLVLMNKHNIPVTKSNAVQFENYRNSEHRIMSQITTVADDIAQTIKGVSSVEDTLNLNTQLVSILSYGTNADNYDAGEPYLSNSYTFPTDKDNILSILKAFQADDELLSRIEDNTATLRETAIAINKAKETAITMNTSEYNGKYDSLLDGSLKNIMDVFENPALSKILDDYKNLQYNNNELSSYMNDLGRATLNSTIKELPGGMPLSDDIWKGDITSTRLINDLNNIISFLPEESASAFVKSDEYLSVLTHSFKGKWTITTEDLNNVGAIEEKYRTMYEQLKRITSTLSTPENEASSTLSANALSLKDNLEFMHALNEMFSYIQLPLQLKGKDIHSDLYVMTNKKKLKQDNSSISVLLHLDMQYLKPLDININLSNNNVDAMFYLEDEPSRALIETNMEHLELALLEKGFFFTSKVLKKDHDIDIVKDFIEKDTPSTSLKRYSFDIRA